jgi:uncharacterized Fe-S cluster-containing radical SAM superfamily protein
VQIDTERFSAKLRAASVDVGRRRLLVTNFRGSDQETDLSEPANCNGTGRIRHFRRATSPGWPSNPLPIDPAARALGIPAPDVIRAQVFQNAACNWRCWYCFVDFKLLSADPRRGEWLDANTLVARYLDEQDPPLVIDLTGGQPDLAPEWVPWMIEAIESAGLSDRVYLWSDDNLSNDYFCRYLSDAQRERIAGCPRYGRVACFKGFSPESFAFNTAASAELFDRQFDLFARLLATGMDLYAYATFTSPTTHGIRDQMKCFVDRLQAISERLPLRTVPAGD